MTEAVSYEFGVTTEAPVVRRPGGKGRPRTNPFDKVVWQSYEENWAGQVGDDAPRGKWLFLKGIDSKEDKDKVEAQIRSAATYWKLKTGRLIGASVNWDSDTGVLYFRGVDKSQADSAPDENAVGETAVNQDADIRDEETASRPE